MPLIDEDYWTDRRVKAMGSRAHIVVGDAPAGVVEWAGDELERLEECWSRFRPSSELTRLNARPGEWVDVSARMLLALTCARDLYRATDGCFDPTIIAALEAAGYDRSFELVPRANAEPVGVLEPAPGFGAIQIDDERSRVRMPVGARLDLGGLGKGLAADLVSRGLVDRGARSALVGIGGDLRARGEAPPEGVWAIPVEHPLDETRVAFEWPLVDGAIVTSTVRIRAWTRAGRAHHHLVDPATGDSARTGVAAVVAAASDAWWAEGFAKAVVIAGAYRGSALARANGVRVWIYADES